MAQTHNEILKRLTRSYIDSGEVFAARIIGPSGVIADVVGPAMPHSMYNLAKESVVRAFIVGNITDVDSYHGATQSGTDYSSSLYKVGEFEVLQLMHNPSRCGRDYTSLVENIRKGLRPDSRA